MGMSAHEIPRLDVIIPTRDRPELLAEALKSALTALDSAADLVDGRVLVINNGRPLLPGAGDPRVVWLETETPGASRARNVGLSSSDAEYVAFLDDDDAWLTEHPRTHCKKLIENPDLAFVFSQVVLCDSKLRPVFPPSPEGPFPDGDGFAYIAQHCVPLDVVVARRTAVVEVGMFNETLVGGEDWDLELRLAARWPIAGVAEASALVRQGPANSLSSAVLAARFRDTLLAVNGGTRLRSDLTRWRRNRTIWAVRGWHAHRFTVAAQEAFDRGDVSESRKCLLWAVKASPAHAFARVPGFWGALGVSLPWVRRRRRGTAAGRTRA
jgi:glycosyltransferase involved in cell wall biosynthesis